MSLMTADQQLGHYVACLQSKPIPCSLDKRRMGRYISFHFWSVDPLLIFRSCSFHPRSDQKMSPRTVSSTSAIVFRNIGQPLQLEPISLQPLLPDEALIEVHATGICHSDLHIMDGTFPAPVPFVLGHEGISSLRQGGSLAFGCL